MGIDFFNHFSICMPHMMRNKMQGDTMFNRKSDKGVSKIMRGYSFAWYVNLW